MVKFKYKLKTVVQEIQLPNKKVQPSTVNPKRLVIYSKPKTGKTSALAGLDNNLILDLEKGSNYVEALKIDVSSLSDLKAIGKKIKENNYPYKFISLDTVTVLEDMVKPLAADLYRSTPMGKNFTENDVLKLPNGAGYMYLRDAFFQVLDYVDTLAPHIILSGHIKDKQVDDKGELVMAANIDLTGKIKSLICSQADAIGYIFRRGNQTIISFKSSDDVTCGARPEHLKNQEIVLAEEIDGRLITYWDRIYK
jgi:hypothetical protein